MSDNFNAEQQLALEYFKALRAEIDTRLKNHGHLSISKIIACTALLGSLAASKASPWVFVVIPVFAVALDFIIAHNIGSVNAIGQYIKRELERHVFASLVTGRWQLYEQGAQSVKRGGVDMLLDRFGQWFVSAAFTLAAWVLATPHAEHFTVMFGGVSCVMLTLDFIMAVTVKAKD